MTRARKKDRTARQEKFRARAKARAAAARQAISPTPARNVQKEPGRPIEVRDVAPYARAMCPKCKGQGMVGYRKVGETRGAEPCKCATTRFWKAHPEIIVTEKGVAYWPVGETPEDRAKAKERKFTTADVRAAAALLEANQVDEVRVPIAPGSHLDEIAREEADRLEAAAKARVCLCGEGVPHLKAKHGTERLASIREVPPGTIVHHLRSGQTACTFGRAYVFPRDWPPGHLWSADAKEVNCQGCLDILAVREHFDAKEQGA